MADSTGSVRLHDIAPILVASAVHLVSMLYLMFAMNYASYVIHPFVPLIFVCILKTNPVLRWLYFPSLILVILLVNYIDPGKPMTWESAGTNSMNTARFVANYIMAAWMFGKIAPGGIDYTKPFSIFALMLSLAISSVLWNFVPAAIVAWTVPEFEPHWIQRVWAVRSGEWFIAVSRAAAILLGVVALAPAYLALIDGHLRRISRRDALTGGAAGLALILLSFFAFRQANGDLLFLLLAATVLVTFFSGFTGAALGVIAVALVANGIQTSNLQSGVTTIVNTQPFLMQAYMAATTVIAIFVGSALQQRQLFAKQLEAARDVAERAAESRAHFLAIMSHEVRSPLASAGLLVANLKRATLSPADQADALERLQRLVGHVLGMLNGILNYARVDEFGHRGELAVVDVHDLVDEVVATLKPQADSRSVEIRHSSGPDVRRTAQLAPAQVTLVLTNLLSNAVQHARSSVSVSAAFADAGERIRFEVADDGPGLSPELRARIFERYFRAEPKGRPEGAGLGLAIARELAQSLGGTVDVVSQPGESTTFILDLPIDVAPERIAELAE